MYGRQCYYCTHHWGLGDCDAFPEGIPERVVAGRDRHDAPMKGQEGTAVFEVVPELADEWKQYQELVAIPATEDE